MCYGNLTAGLSSSLPELSRVRSGIRSCPSPTPERRRRVGLHSPGGPGAPGGDPLHLTGVRTARSEGLNSCSAARPLPPRKRAGQQGGREVRCSFTPQRTSVPPSAPDRLLGETRPPPQADGAAPPPRHRAAAPAQRRGWTDSRGSGSRRARRQRSPQPGSPAPRSPLPAAARGRPSGPGRAVAADSPRSPPVPPGPAANVSA